jgi:hypothetical protein
MKRFHTTLLLALFCTGVLTGCPHHKHGGGGSAPSCPMT